MFSPAGERIRKRETRNKGKRDREGHRRSHAQTKKESEKEREEEKPGRRMDHDNRHDEREITFPVRASSRKLLFRKGQFGSDVHEVPVLPGRQRIVHVLPAVHQRV